MSSIHLFDLAARQAQWLSVRQATVAGNVANANTPDFRARDVQPFADVLDKTQLTMAATSPCIWNPGPTGLPVRACGRTTSPSRPIPAIRSMSNRK